MNDGCQTLEVVFICWLAGVYRNERRAVKWTVAIYIFIWHYLAGMIERLR